MHTVCMHIRNGWLLLLPAETVIGDDYLTLQGRRRLENSKEKRRNGTEKEGE